MEIDVTYEHREADVKPFHIDELARYVLGSESLPFNTEVSISFVDDETIARLNERYRSKSGPTDVLSFPCDGPSEDLSASLLAENPVLELGDVVVAVDVADRQRTQYGNSLEEEIDLLVVHGLLHLCEYDHEEDDEAETMEARQAELLAGWRAGGADAAARVS